MNCNSLKYVCFFCLVLSAPTLLVAEPAPVGKKLYRYTDDKGVVVLNFQIPPQVIYRGYTVLSPTGSVIEVVPPSLTPEQRAKLKETEPERARQLEAQQKREDDDRRLLKIFSNTADAERARDRKLEAMDLQISVDKGNVARLQADLDDSQSQAANKERGGQVVPEFLVEKIDSLNRQITTLSEGIKVREKEKDSIRATYAEDIERMKFLFSHPDIVKKLQYKPGNTP